MNERDHGALILAPEAPSGNEASHSCLPKPECETGAGPSGPENRNSAPDKRSVLHAFSVLLEAQQGEVPSWLRDWLCAVEWEPLAGVPSRLMAQLRAELAALPAPPPSEPSPTLNHLCQLAQAVEAERSVVVEQALRTGQGQEGSALLEFSSAAAELCAAVRELHRAPDPELLAAGGRWRCSQDFHEQQRLGDGVVAYAPRVGLELKGKWTEQAMRLARGCAADLETVLRGVIKNEELPRPEDVRALRLAIHNYLSWELRSERRATVPWELASRLCCAAGTVANWLTGEPSRSPDPDLLSVLGDRIDFEGAWRFCQELDGLAESWSTRKTLGLSQDEQAGLMTAAVELRDLLNQTIIRREPSLDPRERQVPRAEGALEELDNLAESWLNHATICNRAGAGESAELLTSAALAVRDILSDARRT